MLQHWHEFNLNKKASSVKANKSQSYSHCKPSLCSFTISKSIEPACKDDKYQLSIK